MEFCQSWRVFGHSYVKLRWDDCGGFDISRLTLSTWHAVRDDSIVEFRVDLSQVVCRRGITINAPSSFCLPLRSDFAESL